MKFHTEYLWFNTPREHDYVNITSDVEEILDDVKPEGCSTGIADAASQEPPIGEVPAKEIPCP